MQAITKYFHRISDQHVNASTNVSFFNEKIKATYTCLMSFLTYVEETCCRTEGYNQSRHIDMYVCAFYISPDCLSACTSLFNKKEKPCLTSTSEAAYALKRALLECTLLIVVRIFSFLPLLMQPWLCKQLKAETALHIDV